MDESNASLAFDSEFWVQVITELLHASVAFELGGRRKRNGHLHGLVKILSALRREGLRAMVGDLIFFWSSAALIITIVAVIVPES